VLAHPALRPVLDEFRSLLILTLMVQTLTTTAQYHRSKYLLTTTVLSALVMVGLLIFAVFHVASVGAVRLLPVYIYIILVLKPLSYGLDPLAVLTSVLYLSLSPDHQPARRYLRPIVVTVLFMLCLILLYYGIVMLRLFFFPPTFDFSGAKGL